MSVLATRLRQLVAAVYSCTISLLNAYVHNQFAAKLIQTFQQELHTILYYMHINKIYLIICN